MALAAGKDERLAGDPARFVGCKKDGGSSNVLWLDATSFVISALIVVVAVPRTRRTVAAVAPVAVDQRAGLGAGFAFIRRDRAEKRSS